MLVLKCSSALSEFGGGGKGTVEIEIFNSLLKHYKSCFCCRRKSDKMLVFRVQSRQPESHRHTFLFFFMDVVSF